MKLIPLDALVAKIEKRKHRNLLNEGAFEEDINILSLLNTLEVKEVDLEKEIGKYLDANDIEFGHQIKLLDFAQHFFELGVNASNPLAWEEIKTIQNILGEVYAEVAKGKDDFYLIYPTEQSFLEEVLKRFKERRIV